MPNDINSNCMPKTSMKDSFEYEIKSSRNTWRLAFLLTLIVLLLQNIVYMLLPKQIAASEDGRVIGEVIFDEARYRDPGQITADLKMMIQDCRSLNKNTIIEDLAACINHLSSDLQARRISELEATDYISQIQTFGCNKTDIIFEDQFTGLTSIDRKSYLATADIKGSVICNDNADPISEDFYIAVEARVVRRSEAMPYAIEVISMENK